MNSKLYLKILLTQFIRKFGKLKNSNEHILMQDGALPHWSTNVRNWLNDVRWELGLDDQSVHGGTCMSDRSMGLDRLRVTEPNVEP